MLGQQYRAYRLRRSFLFMGACYWPQRYFRAQCDGYSYGDDYLYHYGYIGILLGHRLGNYYCYAYSYPGGFSFSCFYLFRGLGGHYGFRSCFLLMGSGYGPKLLFLS